MNIIYLDVLIIINIYVTYFLIAGTGLLLRLKIKRGRMTAAAFFGGATSLLILLPDMGVFFTVASKLISGALIVIIAIGFKDALTYIKNTLFFLLINFIYAGLTLALWLFCCPLGMQYNNGCVYFDISFFTILISTIAAYSLLKLLRYFLDRRAVGGEYNITVLNNSRTAVFKALSDSGNLLVDFFTGLPVIVGKISECASVCPDNVIFALNSGASNLENLAGIRVIPCSTVCGSGLVYAFKPDRITVSDGKRSKDVSALLGFTLSETYETAVFNPKILL